MKSSVKLLGIEIDNKLNFEKHISSICRKASNQLNEICRLETFMGHTEKEAIINTFVHSNFNYGCLIWHFSSKKSQNKVKKIHERSLKFVLNIVTRNGQSGNTGRLNRNLYVMLKFTERPKAPGMTSKKTLLSLKGISSVAGDFVLI